MDSFLSYSLAVIAVFLMLVGLYGVIPLLGHPKAQVAHYKTSAVGSLSSHDGPQMPADEDAKNPVTLQTPATVRKPKLTPSAKDVESSLIKLRPEVDKLRDDLMALRADVLAMVESTGSAAQATRGLRADSKARASRPTSSGFAVA